VGAVKLPDARTPGSVTPEAAAAESVGSLDGGAKGSVVVSGAMVVVPVPSVVVVGVVDGDWAWTATPQKRRAKAAIQHKTALICELDIESSILFSAFV
jgi:hypothetical protein